MTKGQTTILHEVSSDEIFNLFEGLQNQLNDLKKSFDLKRSSDYLTRKEVAILLKCDISTVHNWTKKGILVPYGIGNRVYYKRYEIENAMVPIGKR